MRPLVAPVALAAPAVSRLVVVVVVAVLAAVDDDVPWVALLEVLVLLGVANDAVIKVPSIKPHCPARNIKVPNNLPT